MSQVSFSRLLCLLLLFLLAGCAELPDNSQRQPSYCCDKGDAGYLGRAWREAPGRKPGESELLLLDNGLDAFVARAVLARLAESSIDTQYYMIHGDHVGSLFVYELWKAAQRGVRVRILLDDIDEGDRDLAIARFDLHPNIQVRVFNPFGRNVGRIWQYVTGFGRQTRRAHNKSFIVDGQATILGGRNIGDEYFSRDPELEFQDLDVLALGPVAKDVCRSFDDYWNSPLSYPISALIDEELHETDLQSLNAEWEKRYAQMSDSVYLARLKDSPLSRDLSHRNVDWVWAPVKLVVDPPEKLLYAVGDDQYQMINELWPYLANARRELIILSPYFVPGKEGVAFLRRLREKGVRVRILTNSLASTDVSIVHAGYIRYRKALLRAGVEIHELNKLTSSEDRKEKAKGHLGHSKSSLHAKAFVVDRKNLFIGSLNLDQRSVSQNTEIGLVIDSPELAGVIASEYDKQVDTVAFRLELTQSGSGTEQLIWHGYVNGKPVTYTTEPLAGFWRRLGISLMRWLPIESQI
ncbi:phospholipase D family protein [Thiolapillus brandeum]|uniref:Phospholipase D/transphosphatidylase n=1 Tax=Thiolapillus brandeum TaxID=1076588 RepID=A0A7U6JIA0_9GAMM|nr:phospholipase D family protein [Thiolapillus brandeum]BAO44617.1 phospholipase D/transphosphatidylase [Thiolapillus brandeum]